MQMARVNTARKNNAGKTLRCGRAGCGEVIVPGEKYFFWEPRYGPKHVRCFRHFPKQSETTTSKMAEVYAATEEAEEWAQSYDGDLDGDYSAQMSQVAEIVEQVKSEYEDAAEHFGGTGVNQEMADSLDEFLAEVENAEFEGFEDWWESNCPEDNRVDAEVAWREDMGARLNEITGQVP
jgi:hypothetical protein